MIAMAVAALASGGRLFDLLTPDAANHEGSSRGLRGLPGTAALSDAGAPDEVPDGIPGGWVAPLALLEEAPLSALAAIVTFYEPSLSAFPTEPGSSPLLKDVAIGYRRCFRAGP
jgi:hypothetical protein